MAHRTLRAALIAIALLAPAVTAYAQPYATVVLRSGERFDGELRGISGGTASFLSSDRRTRQVRMDDIAVITFGRSTAGINSGYADDPVGSDHLLVMRNGNRYAGVLEGATASGIRRGTSPQLLFRIRSGSQLRVRPEDVAYIRMGSSYRGNPARGDTAGNVALLLDNGDVVRGQLLSMDRGTVRVRTNDRTYAERSFNLADLALVDFSGGRPPAVTPPRDTTGRRTEQVLELRDGRLLRGRFLGAAHSASGGDTGFLFRERRGNIVTFAASEATRLYMQDPGNLSDSYDSGRDSYDAWDRRGRQAREVVVNARDRWTPTGIFVREGDIVRFSARGEVQLSSNTQDVAGPSGAYSGRRPPDANPANGAAGGLLGDVNGVTFVIGGNAEGIRMPASGELRLGVNDDYFDDNEGQFSVMIDTTQSRAY
jgi:hypothetical protein